MRELSVARYSEAGSSQRYKHDSQSVDLGLFTSKFLWCLWTMHSPLAPNAENLEAPVGDISGYHCCCCVASVMFDYGRPHRRQPTRLPVPGILQTRTLEWVAISFSNAWKWKAKVKSLSRVWPLVTPMDCSWPGSSVHGSFQARVLEWAAISFSNHCCLPNAENLIQQVQSTEIRVLPCDSYLCRLTFENVNIQQKILRFFIRI